MVVWTSWRRSANIAASLAGTHTRRVSARTQDARGGCPRPRVGAGSALHFATRIPLCLGTQDRADKFVAWISRGVANTCGILPRPACGGGGKARRAAGAAREGASRRSGAAAGEAASQGAPASACALPAPARARCGAGGARDLNSGKRGGCRNAPPASRGWRAGRPPRASGSGRQQYARRAAQCPVQRANTAGACCEAAPSGHRRPFTQRLCQPGLSSARTLVRAGSGAGG